MLRRSAILAALAVVAAACIGADDDPGPDDGGPTVDADTMRLGIGGPLVVDPVEASLASPSDLLVFDLLYDGLTRVDHDGVPQPALATEWNANPTQTAFEFTLDPAATFTSGRAITSQDVITSLERVMAAGDTSLAALSLEAVKGFREFAAGSAEHVSGLTAIDGTRVRVDLAAPLSVLPVVLSSPMLSVVDPDTVSGDLADLDLTGSWTVASAADGDLTLDNRSAEGSLASVALLAHDDAEDAYDAFTDGDVDWAEVPASRYEDAIDAYGDEAFAPFQAELFFGMNVDIPLLSKPAIRQAIALAIDREAIVDEVYSDLADPLTTVVPAGIPGHDPERCAVCAPDPERASSIITFAYPTGDVPTLRIDYDETPTQEAMANLVAESLEAIGIPTELRPLPLEEYEAFVVSGSQELFSFGWIGAYGSADAYLAPLFGSSANDNLTGFRSPRVDALLRAARAGPSPTENLDRWDRAETEILASAVVVPIAQFRTQVVVSDRVEGLETAVDGTVDWDQVRLAT